MCKNTYNARAKRPPAFFEKLIFVLSIVNIKTKSYNLIGDLKSCLDLCMEERTCHEMVIDLSKIFSCMKYLFFCTFSFVLNMIFTLTLKE